VATSSVITAHRSLMMMIDDLSTAAGAVVGRQEFVNDVMG